MYRIRHRAQLCLWKCAYCCRLRPGTTLFGLHLSVHSLSVTMSRCDLIWSGEPTNISSWMPGIINNQHLVQRIRNEIPLTMMIVAIFQSVISARNISVITIDLPVEIVDLTVRHSRHWIVCIELWYQTGRHDSEISSKVGGVAGIQLVVYKRLW